MPKGKTKATNLPVPQSDAEAEQMVARLGTLQTDQAAAKALHDATVAKLEGEFGEATKASNEAQAAIIAGLEVWASANRERLTKGGRTKTVQLPTGSILWRDGRFSVKHKGLKADQVVEAIEARITALAAGEIIGQPDAIKAEIGELEGFLRHKVDLNKEAMLGARAVAERIDGVTVPRGPEEFAVEPLASQIKEFA